jgi:hypothetical protein
VPWGREARFREALGQGIMGIFFEAFGRYKTMNLLKRFGHKISAKVFKLNKQRGIRKA